MCTAYMYMSADWLLPGLIKESTPFILLSTPPLCGHKDWLVRKMTHLYRITVDPLILTKPFLGSSEFLFVKSNEP